MKNSTRDRETSLCVIGTLKELTERYEDKKRPDKGLFEDTLEKRSFLKFKKVYWAFTGSTDAGIFLFFASFKLTFLVISTKSVTTFIASLISARFLYSAIF